MNRRLFAAVYLTGLIGLAIALVLIGLVNS